MQKEVYNKDETKIKNKKDGGVKREVLGLYNCKAVEQQNTVGQKLMK